MNLTVTLFELTTDMNTLARVPEVLARGLDLGSLCFSLVDIHAPHGPTIMALATYGNPVLAPEFTTEAYLRQEVLALCVSNNAFAAPSHPISDPLARCVNGLKCFSSRTTYCGQCRQAIITRHIDQHHRLILMINRRHQETAMRADTMEALHVVLDHLAKSLRVLVNCLRYPTCLGSPFTTLTKREWIVLCCLKSEAGEKLIADRMAMSPHTLHSHIKSIYRKLGVQSRLSMLQIFQRAQRDYRLRSLCSISIPERPIRQSVAG